MGHVQISARFYLAVDSFRRTLLVQFGIKLGRETALFTATPPDLSELGSYRPGSRSSDFGDHSPP